MTTISNWANVTDFLAMGGYGLYVWGSFGMAGAALLGECLALSVRRRALAASASPTAETAPRPVTDFPAVAHEA